MPPPVFAGVSIIFNGKRLPLISLEDLHLYNYDIIILAGKDASFVPFLKDIQNFKIDSDKVILDRTICVAGFSIERYKKLRHSNLSILSRLCWGGFIYHSLGLQFLSPTVNLFIPPEDFLKFLKAPMNYMSHELQFLKMGYDAGLGKFPNYPIFMLDDIEIHMNHYGKMTVDEAKNVWEERTKRINWFNCLIAMETENPEVLEEFDKLPYAKKICFVPFKTDLDSGYYIDLNRINVQQPLWWHVNYMAKIQVPPSFDFFEALLYGKKIQLY